MKTAISISDDLFREADALAKRLGKSQSQLYQEALAEYLLRRGPHAVTRAMDEVFGDDGAELDPWLGEAGRKALERSEW